jgi:4-hydroxy-3-polyprenylbenzoate decarboxylase
MNHCTKLKPEFPWHGYSLGDWCEEWDRCAERAAQSDWILNGLRTEKHAKKLDEPQTAIPIDEVVVFKE